MEQASILWRCGGHQITFPRPTLLMGVLNVTPDSFSDGGRWPGREAAVEAALRMVEEGADLIDIGGESTRPGAEGVSEAEECRRVLPVVEALVGRTEVPLSIDTMKPPVARAALRAGAVIVNDVGASRSDPEMWEVVAGSGAGYVAMHMQGQPRTMQQAPVYGDVVGEVEGFLRDRLVRLASAGVAADQVALDVGIGFGKGFEHNLKLLSCLDCFKSIGRPVVLGVSRKSFLGRLTGVSEPRKRLAGSLACAVLAVVSGVQILRVHDVSATRQAVRVAEAILAAKQ